MSFSPAIFKGSNRVVGNWDLIGPRLCVVEWIAGGSGRESELHEQAMDVANNIMYRNGPSHLRCFIYMKRSAYIRRM